jgi:DNA-binding CsgD family transcriptional regulator
VDRGEAAELLLRHFGRPVSLRLADQLVRRTGGDRDLLASILDQLDPESDGLYRVPIEFGVEVTEPLKARLEALAPQARAVLEAAAVLGREFDLALLERMLSEVDTLAGLAEAQQAGLIKTLPAQVFLFTSAAMREICYDAIDTKRRAEWHERAAAALTALGAMGGARAATVAELAHHTSEAAALGGSTRLDAAAAASVTAGAAAAEAGAHDLSAEYFAQAATMAGRAGWPPVASGRLLVAAGEARLRSARSPQLREVGRASLTGAYRMGTRAQDAGLLAAAALGLGPRSTLGPLADRLAPSPAPAAGNRAAVGPLRMAHSGAYGLGPGDEFRREALEAALASGPVEVSVVARLQARLALETVDTALAAQAVASAGESGDPRAHAEALLTAAALALAGTDEPPQIGSWLRQAAREAEALHDRDLIARASDLLATHARRAGESVAALEFLSLQAALNGTGATAFGRWFGLRASAEATVIRGEPLPPELVAQVIAAGEAVDPAAAHAHGEFLRAARPRTKAARTEADLTPREREILDWALKGTPSKEIAQALTLAERTVETHLASIYRKLGVRTRVELITKVTRTES